MRIASFEHRYLDEVLALWNREAVKEDYKELDAESFGRIFTSNPYFDAANAFVLLDASGQVQGFACGCTGDDLPLGDAAGYITCIVVSEAYRNDDAYAEHSVNTDISAKAEDSRSSDISANAEESRYTDVSANVEESRNTDVSDNAEHSRYSDISVKAEDSKNTEVSAYGMLLRALESRFRELGKKQADVLFFNPMMLPWYIPGTSKHEHNNAPGVPVGSPLHAYLLAHGYVERTQECAMYLDLAEFSWPEEMQAKEAKANAGGYSAELFDPQRHSGIEAMLAGFDNPLWQREIAQCAASGVPVVIAAFEGRAVGFAGPVIRQENGRGYFAGIGVHPDHEGQGLGSLLFFKLCEAFKAIGTDYMSLYTGIKNPAIRIYEKAGFRTVKHFAIMRREF